MDSLSMLSYNTSSLQEYSKLLEKVIKLKKISKIKFNYEEMCSTKKLDRIE